MLCSWRSCTRRGLALSFRLGTRSTRCSRSRGCTRCSFRGRRTRCAGRFVCGRWTLRSSVPLALAYSACALAHQSDALGPVALCARRRVRLRCARRTLLNRNRGTRFTLFNCRRVGRRWLMRGPLVSMSSSSLASTATPTTSARLTPRRRRRSLLRTIRSLLTPPSVNDLPATLTRRSRRERRFKDAHARS